MNVRPFDWRDLPALHRYRDASVFLDTSLVLTRGSMVLPGALFPFLASSVGVFTCVLNDNGHSPVIGQFIHHTGSPFSHLTFLTPYEALDTPCVRMLLEYMMLLSGQRGAMRLLAEVDEHSPVFDALRSCGFAIYTRQRVWQLTGYPAEPVQAASPWRAVRTQDELPIRILYNNIVPGLVQQIEPIATKRPKGMVYYGQGELLAFVELNYGRKGIWAHPFVHPDAENMPEHFLNLLSTIPNRRSRPVYVCIRSYQSWLEAAIEELGAESGPRQAVMAKQLAVQQKAARTFVIPALEGGQPEITAPVARLETK